MSADEAQTENDQLRAKIARVEAVIAEDARITLKTSLHSAIRAALAEPKEAPMPKPEPKPVVTLKGNTLSVGGRPVGVAQIWDGAYPRLLMKPLQLTAAELRAIADWLDQQSEKNDD